MIDLPIEGRRKGGGRADGGVRAVSRALALLDAFDRAGSIYSIAALAREVGLPRTTTLRMVDTLVEEGMLTLTIDGSVGLGPRLIRWGALASEAWSVPEATMQRLRKVAEATGETVSIYIRNGFHRTVVAQAPSPHTLRHAVRVGDELPLWGGAAALVLIGMEPASTRAELIDQIADNSDGKTTGGDLSQSVSRALEDGYAVSHGGRAEGTSGLAIPLLSTRVPAGLALGGPTFRFSDTALPRFLAELRSASDNIKQTGLPTALR